MARFKWKRVQSEMPAWTLQQFTNLQITFNLTKLSSLFGMGKFSYKKSYVIEN